MADTLTGDESHFQTRLHGPLTDGMEVIRVVIAEDQALVRRGVALLLAMEADMEVVGQASNGVQAVELAQLLRPEVVLMDLHMPLKGGVAATREITHAVAGSCQSRSMMVALAMPPPSHIVCKP